MWKRLLLPSAPLSLPLYDSRKSENHLSRFELPRCKDSRLKDLDSQRRIKFYALLEEANTKDNNEKLGTFAVKRRDVLDLARGRSRSRGWGRGRGCLEFSARRIIPLHWRLL